MPTTSKVDKRLDGHSDRLDKLDSAIIEFRAVSNSMEKNTNALSEGMKHLEKIIVGNGEPGLDEQVRMNKNELTKYSATVNRLETKLDELINKVNPVLVFYKVGVWMATALGAFIIALIWAVLTHRVDLIYKP